MTNYWVVIFYEFLILLILECTLGDYWPYFIISAFLILYAIIRLKLQNHFFLNVFLRSTSFFLAHTYKCFSRKTSAKGFSQYLQVWIFISSFSSTPFSSSYSSAVYFLIALTWALKSSLAAFQLSEVFSNPLVPLSLSFFYLFFCCLTIAFLLGYDMYAKRYRTAFNKLLKIKIVNSQNF